MLSTNPDSRARKALTDTLGARHARAASISRLLSTPYTARSGEATTTPTGYTRGWRVVLIGHPTPKRAHRGSHAEHGALYETHLACFRSTGPVPSALGCEKKTVLALPRHLLRLCTCEKIRRGDVKGSADCTPSTNAPPASVAWQALPAAACGKNGHSDAQAPPCPRTLR